MSFLKNLKNKIKISRDSILGKKGWRNINNNNCLPGRPPATDENRLINVENRLNDCIAYSEHLARQIDSNIRYSEYISYQLSGITYSDYIRDNDNIGNLGNLGTYGNLGSSGNIATSGSTRVYSELDPYGEENWE